jgi:hypothetical protein
MYGSSCKQIFHKGGNWADTGYGDCAPINHKWRRSRCTAECGGGQYTHTCVDGGDAGPNGPYPLATTCVGKTAPPNAGSCNAHRCCDCRDCNGNPNNGHYQCAMPVAQCDGMGAGPFHNGCYSTGERGCDCGSGNLL